MNSRKLGAHPAQRDSGGGMKTIKTMNPQIEGTRRTASSKRGFTLFELMIVVLVASTLLVLLAPNAVRTYQTWRLNAGASMIYNKVMEARINAIKRNRQAWLSIDEANRRVQVQTTDDVPLTINVGSPALLQNTVSFQSGSPTEVRFDSMGRPTAPQTIIIETSTTSKTITISATGQVTVA